MKNPIEQFSLDNQLYNQLKNKTMNNSNEVKRTQGEWRIVDNHPDGIVFIDSPNLNNDLAICQLYENQKANAEYIVKACNEYSNLIELNKQLLESLKECIGELHCYDLSKETFPVLTKAKELIVKIEQK